MNTQNFHSESDYMPTVIEFIRKNGIANWSEMYELIEYTFPLTEEDYVILPCNTIRFKHIVNNLHANKTIIRRHYDIVHVRYGLATRKYAEENNVEITDDGVTYEEKKTARTLRTNKIPRANRVKDSDIIKEWSEYCLSIKNTLNNKQVNILRNSRETIRNLVIQNNIDINNLRDFVRGEINKLVGL